MAKATTTRPSISLGYSIQDNADNGDIFHVRLRLDNHTYPKEIKLLDEKKEVGVVPQRGGRRE